MAKKQQVILLHGKEQLTTNTPGLIQGEVAIYNAADAKSTEIYATDVNDVLVPFPSKAYVEDRVTILSGDTSALDKRVENIEKDYLKADDKTALQNNINTEKLRIDAIENDYLKVADKTELNGLIVGLDTRMETAEGDIVNLQTTVSGHGETINTLATKAELQGVSDALKELTGDGGTSVSALAARVSANETAINELDKTYVSETEFDTFKTANTTAIAAKADSAAVNSALGEKVDNATFNAHTADTEVHVSTVLQTRWNSAAENIETFVASADKTEKAIDTLKEIQEFLSSEDGTVQTLLADVESNKTNITTVSNATTANATAIENEVTARTEAVNSLDARITAITNDYLKAADKNELQGEINEKADSTTVIGIDNRLKIVEADYLKAADKNELQGEINEKADSTTVTELNNVVTGHTEQLKTLADSETVTAIDGRLSIVENAYISGAKQNNGENYTVVNHVLVIDVIDCGTY